MPLHQAFQQVADDRGDHRDHRQQDQADQAAVAHVQQPAAHAGHQGAGDEGAVHAGPGLAGADGRGELALAEQAAAEIGADIGGPHDGQGQHGPPVAVRLVAVNAHRGHPGRHDHQRAGAELEPPVLARRRGAEGEVPQPHADQRPPQHAGGDQHRPQRGIARPPQQGEQHGGHRQQADAHTGVLQAGQARPFPQRQQEGCRHERREHMGRRPQDQQDRQRREQQCGKSALKQHADP